MAEHDLRRKAQHLNDLRRRYEAHDTLSPEELAILKMGATVEEYKPIIDAICEERRSATPSKKSKVIELKRELTKVQREPINVMEFFKQEVDMNPSSKEDPPPDPPKAA